jgi:uncharacterized protein (TIGR03067 family)
MPNYLLTLVVALAPAPIRPPIDDRQAILGEWLLVSFSVRGDKPEECLVTVWKFTKTHYEPGSKPKDTYTLDPKKIPKRIDFTYDGEIGKETMLGIYELKGDELKICVADDATTRPKKCERTPGCIFLILKRVKAKK